MFENYLVEYFVSMKPLTRQSGQLYPLILIILEIIFIIILQVYLALLLICKKMSTSTDYIACNILLKIYKIKHQINGKIPFLFQKTLYNILSYMKKFIVCH